MLTVAVSPRDRIRLQRAGLKRELGTGELSLDVALEHPALQTMLLFDLLIHLPNPERRLRHGKKNRRDSGYGERLFRELQRSPLARVQDLSLREREVLVRVHRKRSGDSFEEAGQY